MPKESMTRCYVCEMSAPFTVKLSPDGKDIDAAVEAARSFSLGRGVDRMEADTTASVVRDLVTWVSLACYPPPSTGHIEVAFTAADDGIHLTLRDDGVPLPSFGTGLGPVPPELMHLDASTVDLHMVNHGGRGKMLACLVPTTASFDPHDLGTVDTLDTEPAEPGTIQSRLAQPGDAEAVGRVMHSVYGLGYGNQTFYQPAELESAWAHGEIVSGVALVDGEIVAHAALVREDGGYIYEAAAAAVDPRFRSLNLTGALGLVISQEAHERGAVAISTHMVTTHTRTQSGPARAGFTPTGLLLGAAPPALPGEPRQTLLLAYLLLQRPVREIALPTQVNYRQALITLYGRLQLELVDQDVESALAQIGDAPGVETHITAGDDSPAIVFIRRWGQEEHDALINAIRDTVTARPSMIYIDLNLHTLTMQQLDEIREFLSWYDFMAAGLMLFEQFGHDHLRLQVMLSTDLQIDRIMLLTDEAREVRAVVFKDHAQLSHRLEGVRNEHDA